MYQTQRKLSFIGINFIVGVCAAVVAVMLLTPSSFLISFFIASIVFCLFSVISAFTTRVCFSLLEDRMYRKTDSRLISSFIKRLRFSYNLDDFIEAVQTELEVQSDCSVLFVNKENNYVIYNSPDRITCDPATMEALERNFSGTWEDGYYYMDENLGLVSNINATRGFFLTYGKLHFYVLCRYTRVFDPAIFPILYHEFVNFEKRSQTVSELSAISELSKEWEMVAETQLSFLPHKMPEIKSLDIAAYFRPLVNVSGDYYHVLPIDEDKTLLVLGDVSGKGLAAALVMGVVLNTIKIIENKEDLPSLIRAVDSAIKGMRLQDKYTVLFVGIVDTKEMKIRYINASMSDPIIVTHTPAGYKVKPLTSNCSLIGIIQLDDDLHAEEATLYRGDLVLMASDGVSEVMNDEGIELGDTKLYMDTVQNSAHKSANHFINDIADLVLSYNGNKKLRDDVTMLVAKVER